MFSGWRSIRPPPAERAKTMSETNPEDPLVDRVAAGGFAIETGDAVFNFSSARIADAKVVGSQIVEAAGVRPADDVVVLQHLATGELESLRMNEPVDLAVPAFVALVLAEMLVARLRDRTRYCPRDTLTSLGLGLGSTIAASSSWPRPGPTSSSCSTARTGPWFWRMMRSSTSRRAASSACVWRGRTGSSTSTV